MVSREELLEQFSNFGIDLRDDVLEKCWEICVETGVEEEEFLESWMAYSVSRLGGADPTVELVEQMERDEYSKRNISQVPGHESTPARPGNTDAGDVVVYDPSTRNPSSSEIGDIFEAYCTTPKASKGKQTISSPVGHSPIALKKAVNTPVRSSLHFSPASYSPVVATPSAVYSGRDNAGQVVCSHNVDDGEEWTWPMDKRKFHPQVKLGNEDEGVYIKRYMCNWVGDIAVTLDNHLKWMEKWLSEGLEPWEHEPLDHPCMYYLGRICCGGNNHLSMDSILLEGLLDCTRSGKPVQMDVSKLLSVEMPSGIPQEPCAFFPGQVVVVNAQNDDGCKLLTSKVHSKASAPLPSCPPSISSETGPLRVVVGAGPFTQMDTLSYEPLQDLVSYVCTHRPHVVILIGPFVDVSHLQISGEGGCQLAETFETYFDRMVDELMVRLQGLNTRVILVASARDAHSLPVYPTPPYAFPSGGHASRHLVTEDVANEVSDGPRLMVASDPCFLDIAGVVIGVTSTDIIMHLGREEIASAGHKMDRLSRLSSHLIHQRNFYPLYPPALGVNTDLTHWSHMCTMAITPHILILPSDLRGFIKEIDGCVVMNPERLTKGVGGGSFAKFEVQPSANWESSLSSNIKAQVVKI